MQEYLLICGIKRRRKEFDRVDFVVLDLETTGLDCQRDQVIEIGAVRISHGILCEEFSILIKPSVSIPGEITELTGIDDDMVQDMPDLSQVIPSLEDFLQGSVIVGHHVLFDLGFLQSWISDHYSRLDTVEMAKILLPYEAGYALGDLCTSIGIEHMSAHRALGDARATAYLFLHLWEILKKVDFPVLDALHRLGEKRKGTFGDFISQEYALRIRHFPQEGIKSRQLYQGLDKSRGLFAVSAPKEKNENYRIPSSEITGLFQPGGNMDSTISRFQYRSQQEEMAQGVAACFNQGGALIVEAGTGTGKSLAYLLPAVLWSTKSGNKVVISTHTINLQEQLMNKDIPLAQEITGIDFSSAVIKGRSHYLCLRKWEQSFGENNGEILRLMMRLVIWVGNTETGDINELTLSKKEMGEWKHLAAGSETCFGGKCKFFRGQCFVSRARKMAEQSHLIIVNHSLLLANAMADDNILPEYKYLVLDEAHHLEKVAEDQFSLEINYYELAAIFHQLKKSGSPSSVGLLDQLTQQAGKWAGLDQDRKNSLIRTMEETGEAVGDCLTASKEFFTVFSALFADEWSESDLYTQTVRILPQLRETEPWMGAGAAGENLRIKLTDLIKLLLSLGEKVSLVEAEFGMEIRECHEINMLSSKLHPVIRGLDILLQGDEESYVSWVEYTGSKYFPILHTAPLEVGDQLQQYLFSSKTSVVLTSATLTVGGKFDYFAESVGFGLSDPPLQRMQLASPFSYEENVLLGIASDLPEPGSCSEILFVDRVAKSLIKLIRAAKGRTMVLFTSHYQLKQVYENIAAPLKREGITVYAHGVTGSRTRVLEGFKNKENSVILGANSFWEGIDVMGEALTLVVIVKLPFWPPSLPTVSARLDRYKSLHIDGFRRYTLPQAIIRFRQGFGRLIRAHSDYGAICILDKRIYQKRYGATFIQSLPKMKTQVSTTDELAESIRVWLAAKEGVNK